MTLLYGKKKKEILPGIFCSRWKKSSEEQVNEAGRQSSWRQRGSSQWEGEDTVSYRDAECSSEI